MTAACSAKTADDAVGSNASNATGDQVTTTKNGAKLKWLPYRPEQVDSEVTQVQYAAPMSPPTPESKRAVTQRVAQSRPATGIKTAQKPASRALPNPFADKMASPQSPAPAEAIGGELQQVPTEPKADEPMPDLTPLLPETTLSPETTLPETTRPNAKPLSKSASPYLPGLSTEESAPPADQGKIEAPPAMLPSPNGTVRSRKTEAKQPVLDQDFVNQNHALDDTCPSPKDLKKIRDLTTNILPPEGDIPKKCSLGNSVFQGRSWSPTTYTWTASALCHKPLYFDDKQLERYGHMWGPWVQPFLSGARFFGTVLILPYEMGLELPNECMYELGDYRPGDCAPYLLDPLPLSVRAALFEAGAWTGGAILFH